MYHKKILFFLITLSLIFITSCSKVNEEVVTVKTISVHGEDVMKKTADTFHGKMINEKGLGECQSCHGKDFLGGKAGVSCAKCHSGITVHTEGIMDNHSNQFHGKFIESKNWNLAICSSCHGSDYAGGTKSPTCKTCHSSAQGPEACNSCHGDFANPSRVSPPRSLNNAVATTDPGVGAHIKHLTDLKLRPSLVCNDCHIVPGGLKSAGHIDNSPKSEVIFSSFSDLGPSKSVYSFSSNKCSNNYCHGNFEYSKSTSKYQFAYSADKMKGANFEPQWNKVDGTQGACGTCHGLPPTGHTSSLLTSCANCHTGIVDKTGKIIDITKHNNGKRNVYGEEYQ